MSPRAKAYLPFLGAVLAILSTTAGAGLWVLGEARAMADTGNRKAEAIEAKLTADFAAAASYATIFDSVRPVYDYAQSGEGMARLRDAYDVVRAYAGRVFKELPGWEGFGPAHGGAAPAPPPPPPPPVCRP
jgi:hypothetical protein